MRVRWCLLLLMVLPAIAGPAGAAAPNGLVVLLTDYGADSIYVGALKGAMYSKFPEVRIDAITNSVPAFDIVAGAYMLAEACREFPAGTTFCCVVDPGVGTARKRIVLETKAGQVFVGPDNGLLTLVAERDGVAALREAANKALWRAGDVSQTFQGRDVFGPVAAAVARGVPLTEVGPELKDLVRLEFPKARIEGDTAVGTVIRADSYGNLVTNLTPDDLAHVGLKLNDEAEVTVGKTHFTAPLKSTYADVPEGQKVLVVQSTGLIECAVNMRSLAKEVGEGLQAIVKIKKAR